jgi:hypothetical protein
MGRVDQHAVHVEDRTLERHDPPHQSSGRRGCRPPHSCWAHDGTRCFNS